MDETTTTTKRPASRSVFWPMALIAVGVFFLLDNLGVAAPNWSAALRFWPLLLIFIGLDVLVTQARPPLGTTLSLLVSLAAVAVFGFLLVATPGATVGGLRLPTPREIQAESFNVPPGAARTAAITLHLGNQHSDIGAGDGTDVIAGTIWSRGGLDLQRSNDNEAHIEVSVGERPGGFTFNPAEWSDGQPWEFVLSPALPIDLTLDGGNGGATAALDGLQLSGLTIDGGNGQVSAALPDGDYDVQLDGGNGGLTVTLPGAGRQTVRVDGGNGGIDLTLPPGVAARVEYEADNGGIDVDGRFERVSGDEDEGVYETAGYADAADGMLLIVDSDNGGVAIR